MAEHVDEGDIESPEPVGREVLREGGLALKTPIPNVAYLKLVDNVRKAVAIAMAVFGAGYVVCANRNELEFTRETRESGIWAWGAWVFGIAVLACSIATLALVVEYLARPATERPFSLRSFFVRALFIVIVVVAICVAMALLYGPGQAIGAVIGTFLLLAAIREHHTKRAILAFLAAIVLGLTLLGTQSAYQYARWHADEIVAAGCELMDRCPRTDYYTYNRNPEIDTSGTLALFGQEIQPSDPRVPSVLRTLGARRIWVDKERVAVYVGGDTEFEIYRVPPAQCNPVWAPRWKGSTHFNDRLSTNVY
jgi:hypothetical protein